MMDDDGLDPDQYTINEALNACARGGQWERALELLDLARDQGVVLDVISYNKALQVRGVALCAFDFKSGFLSFLPWVSSLLRTDDSVWLGGSWLEVYVSLGVCVAGLRPLLSDAQSNTHTHRIHAHIKLYTQSNTHIKYTHTH